MKSKVFLPASLFAVGLLSLPSLPASAAALCTAGTVTASGLGSSTSCIGAFSGNDAQGNGTGALFDQLSTGVFSGITNWTFVGKSDEGAFTAPDTSSSGNWSIATGITGPFVLSLKAGNAWSAYFFENVNNLAVLGGTWETDGVSTNQRGIAQDLSHATIYRAVVDTPPPPKPIPEPGTTAALGLFALGAFGRLKQKRVG
ncbi:MAG: PEP-CTERM sorting domain-containing protein [Phormidium tanganyikae FI6-MK23]|nr:PEP-CTERM sorting domain-containing protein [Phormidium tanganyikae FI6-MK23]